MTEQFKTFLIILGIIAAILLIAVIFFRNTAFVQKLIGLFLEEVDEEGGRGNRREVTQKSSNKSIVEMAKLVRKSDNRMRVYESDGSMHIMDEIFELEFLTRKGKKLKIACSADAYGKIPFNEEGSLTYKRNTLVKFKFYNGIIYNEEESNG